MVSCYAIVVIVGIDGDHIIIGEFFQPFYGVKIFTAFAWLNNNIISSSYSFLYQLDT